MQDYIHRYAADYMEKVFYFCLKKTGDRTQAEDLASDITLAILTQLERGATPTQFSAWVWRIARNRYSGWAQAKHRAQALAAPEEEIADPCRFEDTLAHSEELNRLRRELSFISREYRDILVAYYLDDRSVRDIAQALSLPEGTVKSKLFRSRNLLKEGMNMARKFGTRSYKPEEVDFAASGSQPSGLPWRAVQRRIPNNILLQASDNPSTVEELAIELGIAMPYMEEEVSLLVDATLLKRVGDRVVTNFFIADRACQLAVYEAMRRQSRECSEQIDRMITDSLLAIRALGVARGGMTDDEMKWWLVLDTVDSLSKPWAIYSPGVRENGENWGFIGFERTELPESCVSGHNGNGNGSTMFWAYKITDYDLWDRAGEMGYTAALLLGDCVRHGRTVDSLSEAEADTWKKEIDGRFAHADESGNIIPDLLVLEPGVWEQVRKILKAHPVFAAAEELTRQAYEEVLAILKASAGAMFADSLPYYASMMFCERRMMTVHDEVEAGRLLLPADPRKSTIAMALVLE